MFYNIFKNNAAQSGTLAKDRLKLLLSYDRAGCSVTVLEMLKADILNVILGYMDIDGDEDDITLSYKKEEGAGVPVLNASIPIKRLKTAKIS